MTHGCLNLQKERPMVVFGPNVEELDASTTPFYVTLVIHDPLLCKCMLDSGTLHNLKPLAMIEQLGLQINRLYNDLYSFRSRRVKCLGMIKDPMVNLAQIPVKRMVMEIVVADIPPLFDMLLSKSWGSKVGVSIKLDLTYTTIPTFGGEEKRLYRKSRFVKIMTVAEGSKSYLVYGK